MPQQESARVADFGGRPPEYVAYLRVSTREQGVSRLGLEVQRAAIACFAAKQKRRVIAVFEEVQSGRRDDLRGRPRLEAAIATARRLRATLVVARLDRLSRSVAVTSRVLASGVRFVAVDMPNASRVTLHLAAVMAEYESQLTSERTRSAMAAARERGVSFRRGSWHFSAETRLKAARAASAAHVARAREAYADVAPGAVALRDDGRSWTEIAAHLNACGQTVRGGGAWGIRSVQRLVRREVAGIHEARRLAIEDFVTVRGGSLCAPTVSRLPVEERREKVREEPRRRASGDTGAAVGYVRVSTRMQGVDGLGLAAQRDSVRRFCDESGLRLLAELEEVQSASGASLDRRPVLLEALARARALDATLVVARLDRLSRNAGFVHGLLEARARFVCVDAPWADETTIGLLSVLAQRETRLLSERMREVRAQAKASGRRWRTAPNLTAEDAARGTVASAAARRARTRERYAYVEPIAVTLREQGFSFSRIARELTARGFVTQRGTKWTDVSARSMIIRVVHPERAAASSVAKERGPRGR